MLTIGFSALGLFGGVVIIILQTQQENHYLRILFRNPILTFFGKYSYALYIFHGPITFLVIAVYGNRGHIGWGAWLLFVGSCYLATVVTALVSWNLIEKHAL